MSGLGAAAVMFPERKSSRLASKKRDENASPRRSLLGEFNAVGPKSPATKRPRDGTVAGAEADEAEDSPSKKSKKSPEFVRASPSTLMSRLKLGSPASRKLTPVRLFQPDVSPYESTKKALHTSAPLQLVCRERQIGDVTEFLRRHLEGGIPGSLYISGAPGTGKTTTLQYVLDNVEFNTMFKKIFINCMSLKSSSAIYAKIAKSLDPSFQGKTERESLRHIVKKISSSSKILLVLDELDQLDTHSHSVLYTVFEWPSLPSANLVLVGIANALDLTDRILPRLQALPELRPELLHFRPYTKDEIVQIITDRVKQTDSPQKGEGEVLKPAAVQYLAGKIASSSGDARKALDVCRRAVEVVESDLRKQQVLKLTSDDGCNPGSPSKKHIQQGQPITPVSLPHILRVMNEVYGNRLAGNNGSSDGNNGGLSLPLHEKFLVATLLLVAKNGRGKEVTVSKLMEVYSRVCKKRNLTSAASDFFGLCQLVESKGVINIKAHKEVRMRKISLRMDEEEVKLALKDVNLLASVLNDKSVLLS